MKINIQGVVNSCKERKGTQSVAQSVQFTRAVTLCSQYLSSGRQCCRYSFTNKARTQEVFFLQIQGFFHSDDIQFNLSFSSWRSEYQKSSVICLILHRQIYNASLVKLKYFLLLSPYPLFSLIQFISIWHLLQSILVFFFSFVYCLSSLECNFHAYLVHCSAQQSTWHIVGTQ